VFKKAAQVHSPDSRRKRQKHEKQTSKGVADRESERKQEIEFCPDENCVFFSLKKSSP